MKKYPDKWVVVEITSKEYGAIRKVLGSWYGGYGGSDSWQISSGIKEVKKFEDGTYEFLNDSGSIYCCHKDTYGMSGYTSGVYDTLKENAAVVGAILTLVEEYNTRIEK